MPRSHRVLFGVLVGIHVVTALWMGIVRPGSISPIADPLEYRLLALHIAEGVFSIAAPSAGESEMLRTPGYPLVVAATYLFDGGRGVVIVLLQQLLLAIAAYLIYRLVVHFSKNHTLALLVLVLFLIEPQQWLFSLQTMTETLAMFLVTSAVWLSLTKKTGRALTLWMGALVGGMVLVKPGLLSLAPLALLLPIARIEPWRERLTYLGVSMAVALLVVSPWIIRNALLTGAPVVSSSAVYNFVAGLGAPADTALLAQGGTWLSDNAGHRVMENSNYSTKSYPNLLRVRDQIIAHEGVWHLVSKQIVCAPHVWLDHNIGSVLSVVHVPFVGAWGTSIAVAAERVVWVVLALLAILGLVRGIIDPDTRYACVLFGLMLVTVTLLNVCVASSRMLIPLYAPLLLCVSLALSSFKPFRPNASPTSLV